MVLITGDTHGRFQRLFSRRFQGLHEGDYVVICGDFGGIWCRDEWQEELLDELAALPFTVLFADGNHENFDLIYQYPVREWHGGRVHVIRENVLHLMRGEIFEIDRKTFFVMGGAASHDLWNGVYDPAHPEEEKKYRMLKKKGEFYRVKGLSWWEQELPTQAELDRAWETLCAHGKKVDYVITHCAPSDIQKVISRKKRDSSYEPDRLTDFHQKVYEECSFKAWYCGHYHHPMKVEKVNVLYENRVILS